jgi:hypothetical protein
LNASAPRPVDPFTGLNAAAQDAVPGYMINNGYAISKTAAVNIPRHSHGPRHTATAANDERPEGEDDLDDTSSEEYVPRLSASNT